MAGPEKRVQDQSDIRYPLSGIGPEYLVEGPIDGTTSFDIVNRGFARALEEMLPGRVAVFPSEGQGRRIDEDVAGTIEGLSELLSRFTCQDAPLVNIRSFFPPRILGMTGRVNVFFFPWEETLVPQAWVAQFNRFLDGMLVPSAFVKKALVDSGVSIPVEIVGLGVDHLARSLKHVERRNPDERIRFLHVSSCFPRKAIDVLLQAYSQAFTAKDQVTLTIKTFPSELNTVQDQIEALKRRNRRCPEIVLINRELAEEDLVRLYVSSDALVFPSRGEGFGMPIGEAMLTGIPVITTGYGGQIDFCTPENSWLVDFTLQKAQTHFNQVDSVWAEPDPEHLESRLRTVYEGLRQDSLEVRKRVETARAFAQSQLRWSRTVEKTVAFVQGLKQPEVHKAPMCVTWVTPSTADTEIAEYSASLLRHFHTKQWRLRVYSDIHQKGSDRWEEVVKPEQGTFELNQEVLVSQVLAADADCVVIQYHPSLFPSEGLAHLVNELKARKRCIVLSLHRTKDLGENQEEILSDGITNALAMCDRVLVKSIPALNRMKALGLTSNVTLFPHGLIERRPRPKTKARAILGLSAYDLVISSFGLLEEPGGVLRLIEALPGILASHPRTLLLLINRVDGSDASSTYRDTCLNRVQDLGAGRHVLLVDDLLTERESLLLLEASDVTVFPSQVSEDSRIPAVSLALAAGRPILATDTCASGEFQEAVDLLPGCASAAIAEGILGFLSYPEFAHRLPDRRSALIRARSWGRLSLRLQHMMLALVRDRFRSAARVPDEILHRDQRQA